MSKIYTVVEYKVHVFGGDGDTPTPSDGDPHIMVPCRVHKEGTAKYLVYQVTMRGKTLRRFIIDASKKNERVSFRHSLGLREPIRINAFELLMKLTDTCESLLFNNRLLSQSHINPDLIWVDYDANHILNVRLLDIMDCDLSDDAINESAYLSPELLGKRNHALHNAPIPRKVSLTRYDTRPSTLSSVYSIGLVLYFIVTGMDPYEGSRLNVHERPCLSGIPSIYAKLIWIATDADQTERPTIKDFREIVIQTRTPDKYSCISNVCYV